MGDRLEILLLMISIREKRVVRPDPDAVLFFFHQSPVLQ